MAKSEGRVRTRGPAGVGGSPLVFWSEGLCTGVVGRGAARQELRTAVRGWEILLVISAAVVLGVSLLSSTPHSLSPPQPLSLPLSLPQGVSEVARRSLTTIGSISNHLPAAPPQVG